MMMTKLVAAGVLALALSGDASAQTATQWSQLVAYVGKLANRMLDQQTEIERLRAENEAQRTTINATIAALEQERCRVSRLSVSLRDYTVNSPPILPTFVDGVWCVDLKSPVPPFPQLLPPAPAQ